MNRKDALAQILSLAQSPDFVLPPSMDVAMNIKRTIDDPDASIDQMARAIMAEPGLSAEAIAIANSAAFRRSGREITDVKSATSRLGFKNVRAMAAAGVVRQIKELAPTPELRKVTVRLWEHVSHVAALASVIAQHITHIDPEEATFAGVVHESGSFFLIIHATIYPGLLDGGPGSLDGWDRDAEVDIGRVLLQKIGAPETVIEAMNQVWTGPLNEKPRTLADTLLLAHALSPVSSPIAVLAGQQAPSSTLDPAVQKKLREESIPEMMGHLGAIL
jgi:HD-like signal output (HDOD) protein